MRDFQPLSPCSSLALRDLGKNVSDLPQHDYSTMTEVTSQIYQIEKSITDEQEKIVFLSFVFGFLIRKRNNEDND